MTTTTKLPPYVVVVGVPFFINDADTELNAANLLSRSEMETQTINIRTTVPVERQHRLLCGEIASQLLYATGLTMAECDRVYVHIGNALHNTLRDNDFTWVANLRTEIPPTIIINGIPYTVNSSGTTDMYLENKGLGGECAYGETAVKIDSRLASVAKRTILCHEIVHGWLYESGFEKQNDETLVKPLGYFLYLLLRDNDFTFLRGC